MNDCTKHARQLIFVFFILLLGAGLTLGQVVVPPSGGDTGGGKKSSPDSGGAKRQHGGVYNGPGGQGKTGGYAPGGGGERGTTTEPGDPGGRGRPSSTGSGGSGGIGSPGGSGGSGSGPVPISPPAGFGSPQPGGAPGGGGGVPGKRRPGGNTGALGQGVGESSWQNWWVLNEDHFLDLERRYQIRKAKREVDRDLFAGSDATDVVRLIDSNDQIVVLETLPLLKKLLEHDYYGVRAEAALALGKVGSKKQAAWIAPLTKDEHKDVRKAAIMSLGLLQSERSLPMLKYLSRDRRTSISERAYAAIAIGLVGQADSADFLIEDLSRGRRVREIDAARLYALGMIPSPRARRWLDYFVAHPLRDTVLRAVALNALGLHRSVDSLDTMKRALADQDVRVRRSAAIALGQVDFTSRYRAEWDELEQALNGDHTLDLSDRVVGEFASYRARLRVKLEADESRLMNLRNDVVDLLIGRGLEDSDVMVRNFSAIALGELGGKKARLALADQIDHARLNSTRSFAALALANLGGEEAGKTVSKRLARRRLNQETRAAMFLALGLLGEKDSRDLIKRSFKSAGDTALARFAPVALALLDDVSIKKPLRDRLLQKSRPELKAAYGQALSILGDYKAVDLLGRALSRAGSVGYKVQLFAALSAIQDARSLDLLLKAATSRARRNLTLAACVRAIGIVAEKGDRPILSEWFRHLNYPLRIPTLNEIALL